MKAWFYDKNNYGFYGPYSGHICFICKETEKAYQVIVFVEENSFNCWVPKSCTVETEAERDAEAVANEQRKAEYEARRQERYEQACKAYSELIAYAQKMGVRGVREGLRKDTIIRKIQEAGIPLPA
jgi:hypothetical protein